jgi:Putative Flp pilus-assembly TadE/G-like
MPSIMSLLHHIAREQRGAMAITVALLFPALLGFGVIAVDVGNWYVQKRELQTQADAAALAGADNFQYPCSDATVSAAAQSYAGKDHNVFGNLPAARSHFALNQANFYGQSTPGDSGMSGSPCNDRSVDVKMTETNDPGLFGKFLAPNINAQARVSILQQTTANSLEALAVADSAPVAAKAYFVNEDSNNAIIASAPLNDLGPNAQGQEVWGNPTGVAVAINKTTGSTANIGVVIALSGNPSDTTCGHAYVQCFDQSTTTGPSLVHIRGWSAAGTPTLTAPLARSVVLSTPGGSTCSDAYYSNTTTTCTETISAWVDYGSTNTKGVTIKPVVAGSTESALTPGATNGTAVQWTGTISLKQAGTNPINLLVACTKGTGAACGTSTSTSATISNVQRPYAAGTSSGPITSALITEVGPGTPDANSFEVCEGQNNNQCTHNLAVTINVSGSLQNSQHYADPSYAVRVGTSQGNVVGCGANASPSASQYRQNLANGCTGPFSVNTSDPTCAAAATSPFDCVKLVNGVKNGPFQQGLTDRIVSSPPSGDHYYCSNNWKNNNGGGVPVIPTDDSRLIGVFVMPYGSTDASGNPLLASGYVPIKSFATFYVTGFAGDPCSSDDPAPSNAGNAWLVGHFIKYVNPDNGGGSGLCDPRSLSPCVPVMTK